MALPVMPVKLPEVLLGQSNGRLPATILFNTPGQAGGPTVRLVECATRAWRALCAAAAKKGHILKATSLADSYRTYQQQVNTFTTHYSLDPIIGQPTKRWDGHTWWLIPGMSVAAVPGTSNHGYGLAVDTGEERDGDTGTESIDAATLAWLVANEHLYGFSHEVQSEPWHIRYCTGDDIPAAVLAFEQEDDMGVWEEPNSEQNNFLRELVQSTRAGLVFGAQTFDGRPYLSAQQGTWLVGILNQIASTSSSIELSEEQLDLLADKVATRLRALTFVAEDSD